jgi:hypothetical protein
VGYLVGVRITGMSASERARYLAYLGTLERRAPAPVKRELTPARPLCCVRDIHLFMFD